MTTLASLVTLPARARGRMLGAMDGHSVLSALTLAVVEAAVGLGHARAALLAEAGIDAAWLADPDARVPLAAHLALWTIVSRRPDGLALGAALGLEGLGVVGYAMQHGATVGDALAWQARYRAVVHPDVVPRLERRGEHVVFVQVVPPPFVRLREPVDAQAAATVASLRALAGTPDLRARAVALPTARPAEPERARYTRWFGCTPSWGAPALEVAFDASVLALPLPRRDARLFGYLARRADELLAALPVAARASEQARRVIAQGLAAGEPRLAAVARQLGLSARTLHRRLQAEGTRFAALVEAARRERAELLLGDPHLSVSEVAFLLGYSEPAPFFRAFKRWTGETAASWRRARAGP